MKIVNKAHFDLDFIKYAAASVGEKREVKVVNRKSGREWLCKNRTEFYGGNKKGGILERLNENKKEEAVLKHTDFDYFDIQTPEPIQNILHTANCMIDSCLESAGAGVVDFYIGSGDSFRVGLSTLLEYKGNRKNVLKPVLLDEVNDYLVRKYSANIVEGYEVDDVVVMESYGKHNHFIVGVDKDYYGTGSRFLNTNKLSESIVDTSGVGKLYLDNGKVRGYGTAFKMFQACSGDSSDNYKANCCSSVKWGEMSAYNVLKDCKTYRDLFEKGAGIFKHLYSSRKEVVGWKGETLTIDWLYVFQELFNMAHLHRKQDDYVNVESVLKNLDLL